MVNGRQAGGPEGGPKVNHRSAEDVLQQRVGASQVSFDAAWWQRRMREVAEAVRADLMTGRGDLLHQGWVAFRLTADHEERGPHVKLLKLAENRRRCDGVWPIVECQGDMIRGSLDPRKDSRIGDAENGRGQR